MCDRSQFQNPRNPKCINRKRACPEQEDCPHSDKSEFQIERVATDCLLRFEGETVGMSGGSEVSGPVCCGCNDTVQIIGLNGIKVLVEEVNGTLKLTIEYDNQNGLCSQ